MIQTALGGRVSNGSKGEALKRKENYEGIAEK
jgi:hypothetical protein